MGSGTDWVQLRIDISGRLEPVRVEAPLSEEEAVCVALAVSRAVGLDAGDVGLDFLEQEQD